MQGEAGKVRGDLAMCVEVGFRSYDVDDEFWWTVFFKLFEPATERGEGGKGGDVVQEKGSVRACNVLN